MNIHDKVKGKLAVANIAPGWRYESKLLGTGNAVVYMYKTYTTSEDHEGEVKTLHKDMVDVFDATNLSYICRRMSSAMGLHESLLPAYEMSMWEKNPKDGNMYPLLGNNHEALFFEFTGTK